MNEEELYESIKKQLASLPGVRKTSLFFYDQIMGFYYAVSWSKEPWLWVIFGSQTVLLLLVVFARRLFWLQTLIFFSCSMAIYFAENLNELAELNWKKFSTQNYFDKHGVFVSVVFSTPLLIILCIQLIFTLCQASN